MDALLVRRFVAEHRASLAGSTVRRVVPFAEGLGLVLRAGDTPFELGLLCAPGAAWAWCLGRESRPALHAEIGGVASDLAGPAPAALDWRFPEATCLDALRAWILRPGPVQPGWRHLESARLVELAPHGLDRLLVLGFESQDPLGRRTRLRLVAQLFTRGANLILGAEDGREIANLRGRPPALPRDPVDAAAAAETAPALSLAAAAHLEASRAGADALLSAARRSARRHESRLEILLAKLEAEENAAQEAANWRRWGELLSANLHRVRRGMSCITVEDFYAGGAALDIPLDPQLTPPENAALFFKRARRGERGHATIAARRASTSCDLESWRARRLRLETCCTWAEALQAAPEAWRTACPRAAGRSLPELWSPGGPAWGGSSGASEASRAQPAADTGPGRRFLLPGGWEVRVGRSNAENDELTHRFAHPDDVWMHASGAPGSHVVLRMAGRSDNPPREILETVAAIAARFSKAKHSGTVPVIWTRKRYVRKPRGGKPGLAACTHEKTLFVRPGLPAGGDDPGP